MEKKRSIVEWAMHYRSIVLLVTCALLIFGIFALNNMNKNEFPDITIRQGIVIAVYPGATAEDVEQQVTKPLEDYIFTYKEVKKAKTKSFSKNGMAIIQVELNDNVDNKDEFWSKFRHGVSSFKSDLPSGVLAVIVNDDFGDTSALLITLESEDKTYRELHDYMNDLKDQLRQVESVGRLNVLGEQKEQISVTIDNNRLSQYGISSGTLSATMLMKGFVTTAGTLKSSDNDSPIFVFRSMNAEHDVEDMIILSLPDGTNVRLGDIATVRREYPEPSSFVTNNGVKCLVLSVEIKSGRSITAMGEEIDKVLEKFQSQVPEDVKTFKITDQAQVVGDSVANFIKELLIAICAVVLVVILLMPLRVALVASSTIPITIFISLGLFYAFDIELNTVTLAALIMTLGMIVDNSIVIIDSYMEKLAEGKKRWVASIESAEHFFKSIFTATLAISVTFFPFLITMTGTFRDFMTLFPWAITIVLMVSLLVAELVVPFMQFYFIRKPLEVKKNADGTPKFSFLNLMQKQYDKIVDYCFRHPKRTMGCGLLSVVLAVFLMSNLPMKLMPTADRNQFAVEIYLPTGTSLTKTAQIADSLEQILKADSRVVSIASFKGMASPRFQSGYAPQIASTNYAQFIVNTTGNKATISMLDDYAEKYYNYFPEAYVRFKQLAYGTDENPVEIRLTGDNWQELKQTADTLTQMLREMPEMWLARNDVNEPLMATKVHIDQDKASRYGVSNTSVELALMSLFNSDGTSIGTVWEGDYDIAVCLKSNKASSATINDLEDVMIPVSGGMGSVPLRQIATVSHEYHDGQIPHRNGLRTITVKSDVARDVNVTNITNEIMARVDKIDIPDSVTVTYGGEQDSNAENLPMILSGLMMSVAIIYALLLVHFRNIPTATLLLFSLLLTLLGMVLGIIILDVDFSLTCFLGIISLMGILVRNAIIMYDYAEELRHEEGLRTKPAIMTSAKRRMRPIFLTSAAASMGVVPMILGGSGLWMPMGAVICVGTIVTMFLILTVLPVAYWLVQDGSTKKRQKAALMEME